MWKALDCFEEYVCVACLSVMTALTFTNVVARYGFSASFSFSEEITTYLFVLLSLLGAAIAAKRKAHLGFSLVSDMMPRGIRKAMHVIGYLFAINFCGMLVYFGLRMVMNQYIRQQVTAGMQWPEWIFGAFVPFGAFFVLLRFIQLCYFELTAREA
ncbi:MAG: Ectoine/5-hydroxyectoine TRAP transporter small permease protein UehB [Desulfovibrio sp.]